MRIAFDTTPLYTSAAGIARYVRGLQNGFQSIKHPEAVWREFAWPVYNLEYKQPARALKTFYRELVWAKTAGPGFLKREKIDLLHATGPILTIPPRPIKHIVTLHDLAVLQHPERFRAWHRFSNKQQLAKLFGADRILCISRFTANEAMRLLGLPATRLEVVYNGCDFQPDTCPPEVKPAFKVPDEFFLFVGSIEPGKNLSLLGQVYRLAEERKIAFPPLLIVGARWEGVATEGVRPSNWHYLGRQPDGVLIYLYRRALALVFPSKYEGFGLPIAEAMALGCPVVCSRVCSLPEVCGNSALYSELDSSGYFAAMRSVASDSRLRQELIEKGHKQAQNFSWKKCALETFRAYESCFQ